MDHQTSAAVLISQDELQQIVARLASELGRDYRHQEPPLFIGVLKGSFVFLADLVRVMEIPVQIDFVQLSSYASGTVSSGKVRMLHGVRTPLAGRHVIIVEDIVDTGLSLTHVLRYVTRQKPASVKTCTLLDKPSRRKVHCAADYVGVTIPDKFVVGYGMDCAEDFRHLPEIRTLEAE